MRLRTLIREIGRAGADAVRIRLRPGEIRRPPKRLVARIGRGDYRAVGQELFRILREQGGLRPSDRVLDVGCGVGRLAACLVRFLEGEGHYEGFDIDAEMVAWCRRNISATHDRFTFRHIDVASVRYNAAGSLSGATLAFPYGEGAFDLVAAMSVFTHLLPKDAGNYLRQIGRVLRPGGTTVATFFLLNDESRALIAGGRSSLAFPAIPAGESQAGSHQVLRPDRPEDAVAYPEDLVRDRLAECGLASPLVIHPGAWCGRPAGLTYQDVIVARKNA